MTPEDISFLARNSHISDAEVLQDIKDTEMEIYRVERLSLFLDSDALVARFRGRGHLLASSRSASNLRSLAMNSRVSHAKRGYLGYLCIYLVDQLVGPRRDSLGVNEETDPITRLHNLCDGLSDVDAPPVSTAVEADEWRARAERAEAALRQAEADAQRYRWLREVANRNHDWGVRAPKVTIYFLGVPHGLNEWINSAPQTAALDAAIDAAIDAQGAKAEP